MEENKLPVEFKKLWVDTLRSGLFKQGVKSLHFHGAYCCLGIAGVICKAPFHLLDKYSYLQVDTFRQYGIPEMLLGNNISNLIVRDLSFKNDGDRDIVFNPTGKKYTFEELADYINITY